MNDLLVNRKPIRGVVEVAPLGGTSDDWPRLRSILAAAAGRQTVRMLAGTWYCKTQSDALFLPSDTHLVCAPGVEIVASLGAGTGNFLNTPFTASAVMSGSIVASLTSDNSVSTKTLAVDTAIAAGTWICVRSATARLFRRGVYQVISCAGAGSPYTLTLDRRVRLPYITGDQVFSVSAFPRNIRLEFNGAKLSGTFERAINFVMAFDSYASGLNVDLAGEAYWGGICFDEGCYRCTFENNTITMRTATGSALGDSIESSEDCVIDTHRIYGVPGNGILINDSVGCVVRNCVVFDAGASGIAVQGSSAAHGSYDCRVEGAIIKYTRGSASALVGSSSQRTVLLDVTCDGGVNGVQLDTGASGTILQNIVAVNGSGYGIAQIAGTGTVATNLVLDSNALGGIYAGYGSFDAVSVKARDNAANGAITVTGVGTRVRLNGVELTQSAASAANYVCVVATGGRLELRNGSIGTLKAGVHGPHVATGSVLVRENLHWVGANRYRYDGAAGSTLIDLGSNSDDCVAIAGTGATQLSSLQLNGATANNVLGAGGNTNGGLLYYNITLPGGNATVSIYSDAAKTAKVAEGALVGNGGGTITLAASGGSNLTGSVVIQATAVADSDASNIITALSLGDAFADATAHANFGCAQIIGGGSTIPCRLVRFDSVIAFSMGAVNLTPVEAPKVKTNFIPGVSFTAHATSGDASMWNWRLINP